MKIDEKIDEMYMLRERKRGLEAQLKECVAEITECQTWLITRYKEVGTSTAKGVLASATITETLVPQIEDWGQVQEWVMENDAIYLLHRRISSGPWKELQDAGTDVPGIEPYTKVAISLRKIGE